MQEDVTNAVNALEALATAVRDGWSEDRTMNEAWGWNFPLLDRFDLRNTALAAVHDLQSVDESNIDDDFKRLSSEIVSRSNLFRGNTLQYLYNGNGSAAVQVYIDMIADFRRRLQNYVEQEDWTSIQSNKLVPAALVRRIRSLASQLENAEARAGNLDAKIKNIEEAHETAEALPTDLASLREARVEIESSSKEIASFRTRAGAAASDAEEALGLLVIKHNDAEKIVSSLEDAYSAATTKGLGQSFSDRAASLNRSVWIWVIILIVALAIGAALSAWRIYELKDLLNRPSPNISIIWLNVVLGVLSIGGPVWLAWISTRQIGQRFRLAEDYAFKASVAKAYEGYRREAIRVDESFAKELFSTALKRIDEPPLSHIESIDYGSPWHEMKSRARATASSKAASPASMTVRQRRTKGPPKSDGDDEA